MTVLRKSKQKASRCNDEINVNQYTICFQSYEAELREENGEVWIECACGRCMHENCVNYDIVVDANGREDVPTLCFVDQMR